MSDLLSRAISKCGSYSATLSQYEYDELLKWASIASEEGRKACSAIAQAKNNDYRPFRFVNHRNLRDEEKYASIGGGGCCYLTTACLIVLKENFRDDCEELMTLRNFRDTFVQENHPCEVDRYYRDAPLIVEKINNSSEKRFIYEEIYTELVKPTLRAIEEHQYREAFRIYQDFSLQLFERYL